jgi:putative protein-disulfide isomerase
MAAETPEVLYVFDAYCGWCWGFSATLGAFREANRGRIPFRVISGGLFVGPRRQPIGRFAFIGGANERIAALTGAEFGPGYEDMLRHGTLVLDSEGAAAGFAALREQAPERAVELAAAMQRIFFVEGRSLSELSTFAAIAGAEQLDASNILSVLTSGEGETMASGDFAEARALGADAFPALLVRLPGGVVRLPGVGATPEELTRRLDAALARTQ